MALAVRWFSMTMRTFRDVSGADWTVFEVRRVLSAKSGAEAGDDRSFLARGFTNGWLCFENAGAKRRLVNFPPGWRELNDAELAQLLNRAQPAPRAPFSLGDDLGDMSSTPDLRSE